MDAYEKTAFNYWGLDNPEQVEALNNSLLKHVGMDYGLLGLPALDLHGILADYLEIRLCTLYGSFLFFHLEPVC